MTPDPDSQVAVVANKYAFLQEEGSGEEQED